MLSTRAILLLSLLSLTAAYFLTLQSFSNVREATFEELKNAKEGEWRNVCGELTSVKMHHTVAFLAFEDTNTEIVVFRNEFENIHVNNLREHDFLCLVVNVDNYQGKQTFTARRLGYLNE